MKYSLFKQLGDLNIPFRLNGSIYTLAGRFDGITLFERGGYIVGQKWISDDTNVSQSTSYLTIGFLETLAEAEPLAK